MLKPGSSSTSPTKTTTSGLETAMTSVQDDDTMSVTSSVQVPGAPPPTGPNTVVGEKVPTADEIGLRLLQSATFRAVDNSTPSASVVAPQDVPMVTVTEAKGHGGVKENTVWPDVVDEQLVIGLHRLVQYAKDMNTRDSSKSVEQYYSERLAKLIKEGAIEFDSACMK